MNTILTSKVTVPDFFIILQKELNCNPQKANRIFKAVFNTLQDGIPSGKFDRICCQLPSWMKNIYCQEMKTTDLVIPVKDMKSLYLEVVRREGKRSHYDFLSLEDFISSIKAVLKVLETFLTLKDMQELKMILPEEFASK
ncbi:MAG: DUF2267 domain-containing protein [Cytophagaceae bacterium]|nr:DUF2267 domain-containing protein [Cytophagaceae bacterium]